MTWKHRMIAFLAISVLALSGCAPQPGAASATQKPEATPTAAQFTATPAVPTPIVTPAGTPEATPTATATPAPEPVIYAIEGNTIVREQGGSKTVIYDVTEQYPDDWNCWLNNLAVQPEALYFTEGGIPQDSDDDEDMVHALVRVDFDGGGRTVLETHQLLGYLKIVPYGERIFFLEDGFDSAVIGWAWRDGSGWDWLDITDYAAHYDMPPWYDCSALYMQGGMLYADITLFGDYDQTELMHTIRIGTGLFIQHVSG